MDSIPDISELLTTAPIALILLAFIWIVFKLISKMVSDFIKLMDSVVKLSEKLIELIKDLKR